MGKTVLGRVYTCNQRKHPHGRGEDFRCMWPVFRLLETPPRAWGRQISAENINRVNRNTPTGVGKTARRFRYSHKLKKHPHGRGEDCKTPVLFNVKLRNTPTGVGKTLFGRGVFLLVWKHPHGRGEDRVVVHLYYSRQETPPRAWGRPIYLLDFGLGVGNTPTGVGKTLKNLTILYVQ